MIKTTITYKAVEPFIEGLKEMARVVLLGVIPVIVTSINTSTGVFAINWNVVLATGVVLFLTATLKGLDKDIHLEGKLENDEQKTKGLTHF